MRHIPGSPKFVFKKTDKIPLRMDAIRSMVIACSAVMLRHNKTTYTDAITIRLTPDIIKRDEDGKITLGKACYREGWMIVTVRTFEETLTNILHEYLHLVGLTDEWPVSTIVSKLKPEVAILANLLNNEYYRSAAFFAHTKPGMAYDKGDDYNDEQYEDSGLEWLDRGKS